MRPGLDRAQHGPGPGQGGLPGAAVGDPDQVQRLAGTAQVDHLPGGPGQRLPGPGPVAGLPGGVDRLDEVALGGGLQADVVGHPAGQDGEVGGDAPQPPGERRGVRVGQHPADLVELADNRLALEAAAAPGVPGPEDVHRRLQRLDLVQADGAGLVEVAGRQGRRAGAAHEGDGVLARRRVLLGHPLVEGFGDGGARHEQGARAHQSASIEHEVHSRELGEGLGGARRFQGASTGRRVCRPARTCLPVSLEPEVLSGDNTAEPLGEQGGQHPRHRIARDLAPLYPAPHPRGVGGELLLPGCGTTSVDHPREFALRPAREGEEIGESGVGSSAHVKPPGSSAFPRLSTRHVPGEHSPGFARVRQLMRHEIPGVR